jgi:hypothetical protein
MSRCARRRNKGSWARDDRLRPVHWPNRVIFFEVLNMASVPIF